MKFLVIAIAVAAMAFAGAGNAQAGMFDDLLRLSETPAYVEPGTGSANGSTIWINRGDACGGTRWDGSPKTWHYLYSIWGGNILAWDCR